MSVPGSSDVTRGKVVSAKMGRRTLLQITGLDGVSQQTVEFLLPHGMTANPKPGSDVVLLQVLSSPDHVVALGGDLAGNAVADLAPGEFGFSDGTDMILFKTGYIQVIAPTKVRFETPLLQCTGRIIGNCDGAENTLDQHVHPSNGTPPTPGT